MTKPLSSIRVLDLSRVLAGPYCTMQLADLGADVIKIEQPGKGDDTRSWGPPFLHGQSAYFLCCNRNKRSVVVDLHTPAGQELIASLAKSCDVLVENFLPGTMQRWKLGYDDLTARNPRLVYCSITGFGQTGPRSTEPGYDIMIQARAGIMSITGEPTGPPTKVGVAIADITAGLFASQAILAALVGRSSSGRGERIDIALFDTTIAWLANVGQNYLVTGDIPQRLGSEHPNIVPYQVFEAADGHIVIAVGNDRQFQLFSQLLDAPDWGTDPLYSTNAGRVAHRSTLIPMISSRIRRESTSIWLGRLEQAGIPCSRVNSIADALADHQTIAREMVVTLTTDELGAIQLVGSPMQFGSPPAVNRHSNWRRPPRLGEHTIEVLSQRLNLSPSQLAELRAMGVIQTAETQH